MNVRLDYVTFLLKRDCCGTKFPDIAFNCVMETVISNSTKYTGNYASFFLHRIFTFCKRTKWTKMSEKNMKILGKNAQFSEKKAIKMPSNLFWNC